jgi:FtsP/CotA-like multicopper oxidase with cupredoxin domain
MKRNHFSRKDFLRLAGLGAVTIAATHVHADRILGFPFSFGQITEASGETLYQPNTQGMVRDPDVVINMRATPTFAPIFPGTPTQVLSYQASLVKGSPSSLITLPDNYLGPIIRLRQGQRLRVNFTNSLPEDTTVHFHGPCIPSNMGGHPHGPDVVHPGKTFVYEFDVLDPASPFWFHPHPDLRTAFQVYYGLAGLYFITDDAEAKAGLDSGEYDVPLVIQDRTFDANNQFVYLSGGMPMMGMMQGFLGNRILVNGKPDYVQTLAPGTYRLRLYNGSNARTYRLAWQDGTPLLVLGTDGGWLPKPVQRNYITLGPADRVDLWVDFSNKSEGTDLVMQSLPFQSMGGMMGGMMGGGMMGGGMMGGGMRGGGMMGGMMGYTPAGQSMLAQGAAFNVFKVHIQGAKKTSLTIPNTLVGKPQYRLQDAVNINSPRTIYLRMQHMIWTLNGRVFELDSIAPDEYLPFEQLEVWDFVNQSMIAHPMHIHNVQFSIIDRQSSMSGSADYQTMRAGFVDDGWKDTVLVMPGERVRILVKFSTYEGMFMYHCHILEHESMGMMRNLMVGTDSGTMQMP